MEHWRNWKPLAELTVAELRVLAISYRAMPATAPVNGLGVLPTRRSGSLHAPA